jgi:mono/diheme cytochrome c family protein
MSKNRFVKMLCVVAAAAVLSAMSLSTNAALQDKSVGSAAKGGEEIYSRECAKCHAKDGRGKSFRGKMVHARDFTDADWQSQISDDQIIKSIADGKDKMPAYAKKLSEAEIRSLVEVVRSFKGKSDGK